MYFYAFCGLPQVLQRAAPSHHRPFPLQLTCLQRAWTFSRRQRASRHCAPAHRRQPPSYWCLGPLAPLGMVHWRMTAHSRTAPGREKAAAAAVQRSRNAHTHTPCNARLRPARREGAAHRRMRTWAVRLPKLRVKAVTLGLCSTSSGKCRERPAARDRRAAFCMGFCVSWFMVVYVPPPEKATGVGLGLLEPWAPRGSVLSMPAASCAAARGGGRFARCRRGSSARSGLHAPSSRACVSARCGSWGPWAPESSCLWSLE